MLHSKAIVVDESVEHVAATPVALRTAPGLDTVRSMSVARKSKTATIIAAVLLSSGLAACGGSSSGGDASVYDYPTAVQTNYKNSCVTSAKSSTGGKLTTSQLEDYCARSLACVEAKLTLKQFKQLESNVEAGKTDPGTSIITKCATDALK